jgi:hypothetical protein
MEFCPGGADQAGELSLRDDTFSLQAVGNRIPAGIGAASSRYLRIFSAGPGSFPTLRCYHGRSTTWGKWDMANQQFAQAIEQATVAGKSLDAIDEQIIEPAMLSKQQKGALFLFAYSLRRRGEQRRYAQESLAMTDMLLPGH